MAAIIEELAGTDASSLLIDVVDRNFPVIIDLKDGGLWVRYRSRFLGAVPDRQGGYSRLWLGPVIDPKAEQAVRLAAGQRFVATFSHDQNRYRFAAAVIEDGKSPLAGGQDVEGVAVSWPTAVQKLQRRSYYRYEIPVAEDVEVSMWDGGLAFREEAFDEQRPVYRGRLINISVGGLLARFPCKEGPLLWPNDSVGVELRLNADGLLIQADAVVRRSSQTAEGEAVLGLQFLGLDKTVEGRKILAYLCEVIADMQRRVIRRLRA